MCLVLGLGVFGFGARVEFLGFRVSSEELRVFGFWGLGFKV